MTDKELSEIACLLITLHGKDALDAALRLDGRMTCLTAAKAASSGAR